MKLNLNLDPLKLGPFEVDLLGKTDLVDKVKSSEIAERVKAAPAVVAEKVRESQVGPICIAATVGFLSGVVIGLVLSPVKNGINILSNNDLHTEELGDKKQKESKKMPLFKKNKKYDYTVTNDEEEDALSV